ncbi:2'-5' RNA ligase family protein [Methanoregula sp.]|uniref:2'-5' RNA ligase family protein n=1 Tax=Methanoregula sp. TaxID=2052170 RepID=UPI00356529B6
MDDTYLVEIRLARTRWRIKEITRAITQKSGAERYREQHPHVTLYGPFTLEDPDTAQHLMDTVGSIAGTFGTIPFTLDGWERREGMHGGVVAFSVRPSPALTGLTAALARALSRFTVSLNVWDLRPEEKWFHVTIANLLPPGKSEEIVSMLAAQETGAAGCPGDTPASFGLRTRLLALAQRIGFRHRHHALPIRPVLLDDAGLRITVMHNDEILGEYDLLRQRWLSQEEIHDPRSWQETLALYRRSAGFELSAPVVHGPDEIFLIADLHLGHANIIRYCSRPFDPSDVAEMDLVLIDNWNYHIAPSDRVFFLGDLRYGREARPETEYRTRLNGNITFVAGNHDTSFSVGTVPMANLTCDGILFLLVHDPADAPKNFDGWIIHGHHHNNDLRAFPFIDVAKKRVNVSAEVLGYCPVSLQEICRIIREQASRSGEPLLVRYPYVR